MSLNNKIFYAIKVVVMLFILTIPQILYPQSTFYISGYIIDSLSSYPIKDVNVILLSKDNQMDNSTLTDDSGYFILEGNNFGDSILFISKDNFESKQIKLFELSQEIHLDTIFINLKYEIDQSIDVFGEKFFLELKPNKRIINIKDKMITQGKRVIDILKMTPYITVDGEGKILLKNSENFVLQIDGREVQKEIIESMPADLIDKIEIINNPGSKYSSQSSSGVLNIVTQDGISESTYGSITIWGNSLAQYNSYGIIDYSKGKVRLYSNVSGTLFNDASDFTSSQEGENSGYFEFGNNTTKYKNLNIRSGIIFDFDRYKSLDFVSYIDLGSFKGDFSYNQLVDVGEDYNSISNINGPSGRYFFSSIYTQINRDTSFKSDIQVDYQHSNNNNYFYFEQYLANNLNTVYRDSSSFSNSNLKLNVDLRSKIFSNSFLEYGAFFNYLNESNDRINDTLDISSSVYYRDNNLSGNFTNKENNAAIYTQLITELGSLFFSTGARGVFNNVNVKVAEKNIDTDNNYFLILPNVQLGYRLEDYSLLEWGYNYGYKKPRSFMLNPVERISNRGSDIFRGNPDLGVEKIHSFNLSYSKQFNEITISPSLNYVYSNDLISIISRDIDTIQTLTTYENINYSKDINFNINVVIPIRNLVFINSNLSLGWQEYNDSRNKVLLNNTYYSVRVQTNYIITEYLSLNLSYILNSDKLRNQTLYKLSQSFNGAISLNLLNSLNITLLGNDILNTDTYKTEINGLGFTRYYENDFNKRNIALSVSYNFGEYKRKRDKRKFEKPDSEEGLN